MCGLRDEDVLELMEDGHAVYDEGNVLNVEVRPSYEVLHTNEILLGEGIMDKRMYLKVKIKSLAEEARIIRSEERKLRQRRIRKGKLTDKEQFIYDGLRAHRQYDVRTEARATQLAYAFLNGKVYEDVEPHTNSTPRWDRVQKMVERYGYGLGVDRMERLKEWKK